ncbi:MAG: ComF family protein [Paracoccaceae bacterium]|nr:ComF family protein [Paracoccaceae bacterium]
MRMQAALHLLYPPQCLSCDALVTTDFGLCGPCWRDTPFIHGLVCDLCGVPLPGEDPGHAVHCDDCLTIARPWARGRAALLYKDNGRKIVLSLKHGDRLDLARPAAGWMKRAAAPLLLPDMIVAPVPLHWLRLLKRRYNQAALLSGALAKSAGLTHCPDLLSRPRSTHSQEGRDREGRFANMSGAIRLTPRHGALVAGRPVLLVDDVMTSGATLAAGTDACLAAGASQVAILILARVAKDA